MQHDELSAFFSKEEFFKIKKLFFTESQYSLNHNFNDKIIELISAPNRRPAFSHIFFINTAIFVFLVVFSGSLFMGIKNIISHTENIIIKNSLLNDQAAYMIIEENSRQENFTADDLGVYLR